MKMGCTIKIDRYLPYTLWTMQAFTPRTYMLLLIQFGIEMAVIVRQ